MWSRVKRFFKILGPGLVTGASDDDPSGIATYTQTGAQFSYAPLWVTVFTLPLLIVIQEMCARIGIVTGEGMVKNLRKKFPTHWVAGGIFLLTLTCIFNVGADLGMMAASASQVIPLPFSTWLLALIAFILILQIRLPYATYAYYLKWLTLVLCVYILLAGVVKIDWKAALFATAVPSIQLTKEFVLLIVALLGTTISPYLYFWQTDQEVEEGNLHVQKKNAGNLTRRLNRSWVDVIVGMFWSNGTSWFIILTAAAVLHVNGITRIDTADQAAAVLAPIAGRFASLLFALGVVGTGLLAVPILTGVLAYAWCELCGTKGGFSKTWSEAKIFYSIIIFSTLIGATINYLGIGPVKLLIYSAILNAVVAPPLLFAIMRLGSDRDIMGKHTNKRASTILGWFTVALMTVASFIALYVGFLD